MTRRDADAVALANDGQPNWDAWARMCIASGSIVPPLEDRRRRVSRGTRAVLAIAGIAAAFGIFVAYPLLLR